VRTTAGHQDGPRIRQLRKDRGLTVDELATELGVHPGSLRNVENGRCASIGLLIRLADFFDVPVDDILRKRKRPRQSAGARAARESTAA
jgi:transcriptional regulator with XRE-family HTH domain